MLLSKDIKFSLSKMSRNGLGMLRFFFSHFFNYGLMTNIIIFDLLKFNKTFMDIFFLLLMEKLFCVGK